MYKLCDRLQELRKRENISQNALANSMNLTRASINAWEMGVNSPNSQSLIMLSKYFKVSADYLLGLDDRELIDIGKLNNTEKEIICSLVRYFSSLKEEHSSQSD